MRMQAPQYLLLHLPTLQPMAPVDLLKEVLTTMRRMMKMMIRGAFFDPLCGALFFMRWGQCIILSRGLGKYTNALLFLVVFNFVSQF